MATINGVQTINDVYALSIATDPSAGGGTVAPIGSFGGVKDGSGFWYKSGAGDTAWGQVPILTSGVLSPSLGGTGINNAGTFTNASNTTITGGGTIALGGFTLTIPATGTVPLGTGVANRVALWTTANGLSSSAVWTWNSTTGTTYNSAIAGGVVMIVQNAAAGATSFAEHRAGNGTYTNSQIIYGSAFTAAGLIVPHLSALSTTSNVGMLFASTAASTKMWWAIGGTALANEVMSLTSTELTVPVDIELGSDFIALDKTIDTTAGDSATINSIAGRFRKDTTGATFTLTNSYITANSIIILTLASDPGLASSAIFVVAGAGSAVITFQTIPLANTDVNFFIIN